MEDKNLFSHPTNYPQQSAEFEFKMLSVSSQTDTTGPSPADELFYKGKLLPLHLPQRLQMFQKLLQNSNNSHDKATNKFDALYTTPLTSTTHEYFFHYSNESRHVSRELEADKYMLCDKTEVREFINMHPKKHLTKSFKFIKASRNYLKSMFSKTSCSSTVDCMEMDNSSFYFSSRLNNSNEICERSRRFDSELESSIQSAIAHCKRSSQGSVSDIGFCSLSGSRVVFEDHER